MGHKRFLKVTLIILLIATFMLAGSSSAFASPSGNLNCQIPVGNLVITYLNPHYGPCGRFGPTYHCNILVDYARPVGTPGRGALADFHLKWYTTTGSNDCLYICESNTDLTVFDTCFNDLPTAASNATQAMNHFLSSLKNINIQQVTWETVALLVLIVVLSPVGC
jgi:hypothetical protein